KAKTKTTKKRPQHATSNVFAMFDQSQSQEFKEAFNMIDQNRDGFIDKKDLHDMLALLGKTPTDECLDAMMNKALGPINFTTFLTMFGEKLNGTDPEDVIGNAFACFCEAATGTSQDDYLRELLTTVGDWFTDEEVEKLYREAPIDKKGNFNYVEFTHILKHRAKDKDDWKELQIPANRSLLLRWVFPRFSLRACCKPLALHLLLLLYLFSAILGICIFIIRLEMGLFYHFLNRKYGNLTYQLLPPNNCSVQSQYIFSEKVIHSIFCEP
uniref:EF-hand domain-containing protein n=1 Tax=Propithecus coquereli TaxID=379532 RepID=A0A2K6ETD6_PROCO